MLSRCSNHMHTVLVTPANQLVALFVLVMHWLHEIAFTSSPRCWCARLGWRLHSTYVQNALDATAAFKFNLLIFAWSWWIKNVLWLLNLLYVDVLGLEGGCVLHVYKTFWAKNDHWNTMFLFFMLARVDIQNSFQFVKSPQCLRVNSEGTM
jgi:hypothetical protein